MKLVTIVGARPQFIKAAPMSRAIRAKHTEVLVHTGQHYDDRMSDIFFRELNMAKPDVNLAAGGGTHGEQTAKMLAGIEQVLLREAPDWLLVFGDTNSTAAGALAASKLHIPIAHVEAGLRSFNRQMPEEVNRVVADHLSTLLLCPSDLAISNLRNEGITRGVRLVGDVMADALLDTAKRADTSDILSRCGLSHRAFVLATVHRAENTDDTERLKAIISALGDAGRTVLFPVHPRTKKALDASRIQLPSNVCVCEPLGYLDTIRALRDCFAVLTDSGGLQKEAYWLSTPCVTLRDETEWVETVESGWNSLAGANRERIVAALDTIGRPARHPNLYGGDGAAASRVLEAIENYSPTEK